MNSLRCLTVGVVPDLRETAEHAARLAFPEWTVLTDYFPTLEEALESSGRVSAEILVVSEVDRETLQRALEATNGTGLPRWAVVVLGRSESASGFWSVPREDCEVPRLARNFRSALEMHRLRQDNARMNGDLRTLAQRITHDLRTPLGAIGSTGELLTELLLEQDPTRAPLTKALMDGVSGLERIIQRVGLLLHASASPPPLQPTAMGEIVRVALERLERPILQQRVSVTVAPQWPTVEGLPLWLETVWTDLLLNALQHGAGTTHLELGWRPEIDEVRFWVADDGAGVAAERRASLIRPFHRLHPTRERGGLGLAIAQRLIELQGGRLGYEPRADHGSIFYFTLPTDGAHATVEPGSPGKG